MPRSARVEINAHAKTSPFDVKDSSKSAGLGYLAAQPGAGCDDSLGGVNGEPWQHVDLALR